MAFYQTSKTVFQAYYSILYGVSFICLVFNSVNKSLNTFFYAIILSYGVPHPLVLSDGQGRYCQSRRFIERIHVPVLRLRAIITTMLASIPCRNDLSSVRRLPGKASHRQRCCYYGRSISSQIALIFSKKYFFGYPFKRIFMINNRLLPDIRDFTARKPKRSSPYWPNCSSVHTKTYGPFYGNFQAAHSIIT